VILLPPCLFSQRVYGFSVSQSSWEDSFISILLNIFVHLFLFHSFNLSIWLVLRSCSLDRSPWRATVQYHVYSKLCKASSLFKCCRFLWKLAPNSCTELAAVVLTLSSARIDTACPSWVRSHLTAPREQNWAVVAVAAAKIPCTYSHFLFALFFAFRKDWEHLTC
jgi:hypothetical protein